MIMEVKMKKIKLVLLSLLTAGSLIGLASADIGDGCGMMGGMYGVYGGTGMIFSWLFAILVLIALVLLIFWLIKQIQNPPKRR